MADPPGERSTIPRLRGDPLRLTLDGPALEGRIALVATPQGYAAAWQEPGRFMLGLLDRDGVPQMSRPVALWETFSSSSQVIGGNLALTPDRTALLAVWAEGEVGSAMTIYAYRIPIVSGDGGARLEIVASGADADRPSPTVAIAADRAIVAWIGEDQAIGVRSYAAADLGDARAHGAFGFVAGVERTELTLMVPRTDRMRLVAAAIDREAGDSADSVVVHDIALDGDEAPSARWLGDSKTPVRSVAGAVLATDEGPAPTLVLGAADRALVVALDPDPDATPRAEIDRVSIDSGSLDVTSARGFAYERELDVLVMGTHPKGGAALFWVALTPIGDAPSASRDVARAASFSDAAIARTSATEGACAYIATDSRTGRTDAWLQRFGVGVEPGGE